MAQLTKDQLKKIFVTNRKLVQRDYHDLLDSILFNTSSSGEANSAHSHTIHNIIDLAENLALINATLNTLQNSINNIDLVASEPTAEKLSTQITVSNQHRFVTSHPFHIGSLRVLLNGLEQINGEMNDYTILINGSGYGYGIVMNDEMPLIPVDNLTVFYISINTI